MFRSHASTFDRRWLLVPAVAIALLCWPALARANWGPNGECGIKGENPNEHCYAIAIHETKALASIANEDTVTLEVHDWATGAFIDAEEWISFNEAKHWIETGQTAGNGESCCTLHPFSAKKNAEGYRERLSEGTLEGGANRKNWFMLYDAADNGDFHVYWGCRVNSNEWCEVWSYGGWPDDLDYQEAGEEDAGTIEPNESGHDEVAWSDGGEYYAWRGATYYKSPALELRPNKEEEAAGDIEWDG